MYRFSKWDPTLGTSGMLGMCAPECGQSWDDRKRLINGDGAYSVRQSVSVARTLGLF